MLVEFLCLDMPLKRHHNSVSSRAWIHLWNYLVVSVQGCKPAFHILCSFSMCSPSSWQYQWLEFLQKKDKHGSKGMSTHYSLNLQKYRNDRIYTQKETKPNVIIPPKHASNKAGYIKNNQNFAPHHISGVTLQDICCS